MVKTLSSKKLIARFCPDCGREVEKVLLYSTDDANCEIEAYFCEICNINWDNEDLHMVEGEEQIKKHIYMIEECVGKRCIKCGEIYRPWMVMDYGKCSCGREINMKIREYDYER